MSPGLKLKHVGALLGVTVLLAFQNCAQPIENESSSSSLEALTPFAYSATPDTIAHMSCSGLPDAGPDPRAYFSFRVGGYDPNYGGLSTTLEFREAMKYYSVDQLARIFGISAKNSNTNLSLSLRQADNYQRYFKEGQLVAGEELDAMLPELDSFQIAGPLAASAPNQKISYFPGASEKRLMEGSLRYYHFENNMAAMRKSLTDREMLMVVGYSDTTDPLDVNLRVPDDNPYDNITPPSNRAYGTGYFLRFSLPSNYGAGEPRVISPTGGVEEIDLATGSSKISNWDCSAAYQFLIVRPEDVGKSVVCNHTVDSTPTNQVDLDAYKAIRRVLRVEDWFVDLDHRCVIPKRTGDYCYGPMQGRTIQYPQVGQTSYTCSNPVNGTTYCPHFVSVCIRR